MLEGSGVVRTRTVPPSDAGVIPLPGAICGACGAAGHLARFRRSEAVEVRGIAVRVTKVLRGCGACRAEFENSLDPDWRLDAYAGYRAARGWLTPEEIRDWREARGLTREEATSLLGWRGDTLGRYERGALASEAHNADLARLIGANRVGGGGGAV